MKNQNRKIFKFDKAGDAHYIGWSGLQNAGFFQLLSLFSVNWKFIEFYKYGFRILAHLGKSILTSSTAFVERILYRKQVSEQKIHKTPLLIIGHFRSGTTFAHNLLSLNDAEYSYSTFFQNFYPSTFLLQDRIKNFLVRSLEGSRPMDNITNGLDLPQEDDLGLMGLTNTTPIVYFGLPSSFKQNLKYYNLEDNPKEKKQFVDVYKRFIKRVTLQNKMKNKPERLVLKSPLNTARLEAVQEIFPDAKYVFMVRNPYDVFKSMIGLYETLVVYQLFETPSDETILEVILTQYEIIMNKYLKAKEDGILVEGKNLIEVKYEELTKNISGKVEEIYDVLDLPGWEYMKKKVEVEEKKLNNYKRNNFNDLDPELKEIIYKRWKVTFDTYGYEK
eukprot:maker-scaffold_43-snap-gene-1.19-mRNA-1 protein AED:0.71 eAED:0.80 QI:0/0/0/1/1/1/2/0/388